MSEILEFQITELINQGDYDKAFGVIMTGYKERLYWHIRKMVISHEDTDDVLQNTCIKIWRNLPKFEGRSQVFSWSYRIATNESLTFLDKKKRKRADSFDDVDNQIVNTLMADEYFDGDYAEALLIAAVKALPEKQRLVFNMKYYEDMKYTDISDVLDTSVGGLKASYHHAVKKIEEFIKNKQLDLN
ncbi:MAG: RNA polymerase sigma factor (sigma-70 family) [Salibacteraceae bacterium]|jgi:RNA polymerase sigma factor (sigma-70 family)